MHNVQTSLLPFNTHPKFTQVPEGSTLSEIVGKVFPHKVRGLKIAVSIEGDIIPPENWSVVRPKQGTMICVNIVPTNSGGKKNPLATILSIAVMVAAPYIAGAAAFSMAGGVYGAGVYTAMTATQYAVYGALRIGIGMVGYLATSMLSSTPKQSSVGSQSIKESRTQYIEGASNSIDKFGVIPVNLGTNRMYPPQAALPYTESSSNKQYSRQLFTYGYGKLIISERKIGETLISQYEEVEMEDRLNEDLDQGVSIYSNDVYQEGLSSTLVGNAEDLTVFTTQKNANEFELDLTFSQGLVTYSADGKKYSNTCDFEIVYAPTGTTDWSTGYAGKSFSSQSVTIPAYIKIKTGFVLLNLDTGVVSLQAETDDPIIPEGSLRIGSYSWNSAGTLVTLTDERSSHIPSKFSGFGLSVTGDTLDVDTGTVASLFKRIKAKQKNSLTVSYRRKFPTVGQYDIGIRKITTNGRPPSSYSYDSTSTYMNDVVVTALKSIKDIPPVNQKDVSGSGMRIRATDQLNGSVQQYNVIASTIVNYYDADLATWTEGISSNPAAIYRYVLQSKAFVKRLTDDKINLTKLEEWSVFCDENNLTYNRIIDYDASIDDILNDICAAGMATKHTPNGIYGVIIDNERPIIKGVITPRNSWGYKGNINYPQLPHALRVQFRNKNNGYMLDEVIVYNDGYDETNASEFERLEFNSCTDAKLAYWYGRRYLTTAKLQPETHTFSLDYENLTFSRGDRIVFVHDSILVGVGQGRIIEILDSGGFMTGFRIDDVVDIPTTSQFAVRIRHGDASGFTYHLLTTSVGETDTFTLASPIALSEAPDVGSLCAFVEDGKELDLVITNIKMNKDHSAQVTCVNYAEARFDPLLTIPSFSSNVTLPSGFYRPLAPLQKSEIISDETVMLRNSDGSFISRMIIPLVNLNEKSVAVNVRIKPAGSTEWDFVNILSDSPDLVILTGLEDGNFYDIEIRYQRRDGLQLLSEPLILNNIYYTGSSTAPDDVLNFDVSITDNIGLFSWTPNDDIDLSHYQIRFSSLTSGATWGNSQITADKILGNRIALPIQSGTYLIKAFDISDNESTDASVILSDNQGAYNNAVEVLTQETTWAGTKENCQVISGDLFLIDTTLPGIYYFDPDEIDLSEIYESIISSSIKSYLTGFNRIRTEPSIRSLTNIRGVSNKVRLFSSIRSVKSIRGLEGIDWSIALEMNLSSDGVTWSGWVPFVNGKKTFRYAKFRIVFSTSNENTNVRITNASISIDMPDRIESEENVSCPDTGVTITYPSAFKNNPAVNITVQNGAVDDKLEYVSKSNSGFTIKIYNATVAGYVSRSFDYSSRGYGRVL